jgi:hypothetical protein
LGYLLGKHYRPYTPRIVIDEHGKTRIRIAGRKRSQKLFANTRGAIARPDRNTGREGLPKTRSEKIMRSVYLRKIAGRSGTGDFGDTRTLRDPLPVVGRDLSQVGAK